MSEKTTDLANALRVLSMDAVQSANSGHPGMPMGMADIAEVLWRGFLKHNPNNPNWPNRDRFILSNGHGSMLLYALLHLSGYQLSIEDLKAFRQLHSKTPGHPEFSETPGVEATTGPLGQGLAMAVGEAIAEKQLNATFNRDEFAIIDHHTYAFVGDGCLMEGISHEAASLAGTLNLGKLIVFYDDNGISIDGDVKGWFSDDTALRFRAYQWQVIDKVDGHNSAEIKKAIEEAKANDSQPSLIICKTTIGFGSPNLAGSEKSHGAPLGDEELARSKERLNWPHPPFVIPEPIRDAWSASEQGQNLENAWLSLMRDYRAHYPDLACEFERRINKALPEDFVERYQEAILQTDAMTKPLASRKASQYCIEALEPILPELFGGSADLTGSNNTRGSKAVTFEAKNPTGNYLYYGVREFGMSAMLNGISLHGGLIPFAGTFLVFSDYAKNAIRLSAMMKQKVIYVLSHDSIGLGEDGPTHQPIEQLASLRLTPGLEVWRPADNMETAIAWQEAIKHDGPSAIILSRQTLKPQHQSLQRANDIKKGAYVLSQTDDAPDLILISTGSELSLAMGAKAHLENYSLSVRVVSMPSVEAFLRQANSYRESVLPSSIKARVAIEASHADYWYKWVGLDGAVIGLSDFGLSAPGPMVYQSIGLTEGSIVDSAKKLLTSLSLGVNL